MEQPLVIIGSGLAGYSLVKEIRQLGSDRPITLITADRGDYYSKPQLSTAFFHQRTPDDLLMQSAEEMAEKYAITVHTQMDVMRIEPEQHCVVTNQGKIDYSQLVLALGAQTVLPPLDGDAVESCFQVNTLEDYEEFHQAISADQSIAILGAGLVGCEMANDLAEAGMQVHVIAPDDYPLMRFVPMAIGEALQTCLAEKNVQWHLGKYPKAIHRDQGQLLVTLDDETVVHVDHVLSAVGLRPNTALAESAGLEIERGIIVNEYCQTSHADIYALGDCAEVVGSLRLHIAPLLACARALANTLTGTPTAVVYPPMPIMVKTTACSINTLMPPTDVAGDWQVTGEGLDLEATFRDASGQLHGFTLSGGCIKKRMNLIKELESAG